MSILDRVEQQFMRGRLPKGIKTASEKKPTAQVEKPQTPQERPRSAFKEIHRSGSPALDRLIRWSERPVEQVPLIPAPPDQNGKPRVRTLDQIAQIKDEEAHNAEAIPTNPQTLEEAARSGRALLQESQGMPDPGGQRRAAVQKMQDHMVTIPSAETSLRKVEDFNTRWSRARSDIADDPNDASDDVGTTYETEAGLKFKDSEKLVYYNINGTIIEGGDLAKALKAAKENPQDAPMFRLPDGREVSREEIANPDLNSIEWEPSTNPKDPNRRKGQDGNYYVPKSFIIAGQRVSAQDRERAQVAEFDLGDGRTMRFDDVPKDQEGWDAAVHEYRAPDRLTVIAKADGTRPEDAAPLYMDQTGESWHRLDVSNPRAPWQDEAGNNIWNPQWHPEHSTADEILPWFVDANLSSAPYYLPGYNLVSGAAAAFPYTQGIKGSTYEPDPNTKWWELHKLGNGTYSPEKMTEAQRVGGATAPIIDALAERYLGPLLEGKVGKGKAIGGANFFGPGAISKILSSGIVEGLEEIASAPSQELEETSLKNYGRPRYYNRETGRYEYDMTSPAGFMTPTAMNSYLQNFSEGMAIGGPIAAGEVGLEKWKNRGKKGESTPELNIPPALSRQAPQLGPDTRETPARPEGRYRHDRREW